ncbi:hypothetical protein GCM10010271_17230 [Streptomyces kurssanovii]|nr:hypothetical protein GCM10010271_17230 [Streptomyces kurssanovii]
MAESREQAETGDLDRVVMRERQKHRVGSWRSGGYGFRGEERVLGRESGAYPVVRPGRLSQPKTGNASSAAPSRTKTRLPLPVIVQGPVFPARE